MVAKTTKNSETKNINRIIGVGMVRVKQDIGQNQRKEHFFDPFDVMSIETGSTPTTGIIRLARGTNATGIAFCDETAEDVANRIMAHKVQFAAAESLNDMSKNSMARMVELICASVLTNLDKALEEKFENMEIDYNRVAEMVKTVLMELSRQEKAGPVKSAKKG